MALMNKKAAVTTKLPTLQNLIKRDPPSYHDEFFMQKRHFDSELEIFKMRPTKESERFTDLVTFMSHVASCYKDECGDIPLALLDLLEKHATTLHFDVRIKLFQALVLLRNKAMVEPIVLLKLSFKLFSVPDKSLRSTLSDYIFNDIKGINEHRKNEKLNKSIQAMLFNIVAEDGTIAATKTVEILAELYRRRIWTDARTVNVIGEACTSQVTRVVVTAVNFFLGIETKMAEDDDEEKSSTSKEVDFHKHSKKTKKRMRQVQRQVEHNSKRTRDQAAKIAEAVPLFPAIQLLHDPQALSEKVVKKVRQPGERFEVKLLLLNFISRLIGCHKLIMVSFYSFLQKYLTSHQKDVTHILAYLIQACHDLVPPEDLMPIVKAIAYNFITERCTNEVIAVGINSVREIFSRVPSLLREPGMDDFITDLAQYGRKSHKSVMISAHGLINLVRETFPALLKKSDRGKFHDPFAAPARYGEQIVSDGVDNVELLDAYERGEITIDNEGEVHFKGEGDDEEKGGDENDDGWEEVESGDEDDSDEDDDDDDSDDEEVEVEEEEEEEEEVVVKKDQKKGKLAADKEKASSSKKAGADNNNSRTSSKQAKKEEEEEEEEDEMEVEDDDEEGWMEVASDDEEEEGEDGDDGEKGEDGDGDEWESVDENEEDSDDDDEEDGEEEEKEEEEEEKDVNADIRQRADARRMLTNEDFALLERLRTAQSERAKDPRFRTKSALVKIQARKREREEEEAEEGGQSFAVDASKLAPGAKTRKMSKIERITRVLEGRKESKFEHNGHAGGLTNKEKLRKKNYVMVRRGKDSVMAKIRKSNSESRYEKMHRKEQVGRDRRKRRRT